jgi:hypothetical protein
LTLKKNVNSLKRFAREFFKFEKVMKENCNQVRNSKEEYLT